jgi:carboxypeptidase C (cathepsin A)
METSLVLEGSGCLALLQACNTQWDSLGEAAVSTLAAGQACNDATAMCRNTIDFPFLTYTQSHNYDVRAAAPGTEKEGAEPLPPGLYQPYLNQAHIAQALGVETNYTFFSSNAMGEVYAAFSHTGDFGRSYLTDLEELLDAGVPVSLFYGDADWVSNWFGGEMLSLATNYTGVEEFKAAGYESLMVDGEHRGDVRQHAGFSFTRVFDAGHAMPFYQPEAAYALFERTIKGRDLATGDSEATPEYSTSGPANSTHSQVSEKAKRDLRSARFRF